MKNLFTLFVLAFTMVGISLGQSSATATYNSGIINSNYGSYSSSCNLGDTLNIAVPAGSLITGIDISYNVTATGGGWMMEQRSKIECIDNSTAEPTWYAGSGYSGTYSYNRTNVDIANGISNGSVTFRMQLYRTWGGSGCNSSYQYVPSGTWSITVHYCPGTPTYTPILSQDTVFGNCGDSAVSVSANSNYTSFLWANGDTNSSTMFSVSGQYLVLAYDAGGCPYPDTVTVSVIAPNIDPVDTTVCEGETVELDAIFDPDPCVKIESFDETNYAVADHNSLSGDDRGGIAITPDYYYYVGDNNTVRFNASNLSGGVSLPQRDGIFSDLSDGQLYTLWDTVGNSFNYSSINAIRMMDAGLNLGTTIGLSMSINAGYSSFVAAGSGFMILWANNNDTFYHIDLSDGTVTSLGSANLQNSGAGGIYMYGTENWAMWGIAECAGSGYAVVGRCYYLDGQYQYSPGRIGRWDIANGEPSLVTDLSGSVSDMGCITYSRWEKRWYFHYEGSGMFGGSSETAGYADASTGGANFNFSWNTGDSVQVISVTPDSNTTYIVEVSDGFNSCFDTAQVDIVVSPNLSMTGSSIACKGDSTGTVSSSLTQGSATTYTWTAMNPNLNLSGSTGTSISNVPAGYYILYVEDALGCSDMDTAEVTEPSSIFSPIMINLIDPLCSYSEDGRATILAAGGDAPYDFNWSNGNTNDTNMFLGNGAFTVTVTDANGCERFFSGSLTAPPAVVHNLTATGNVCEDDDNGTAQSAASGGTPPYSYLWSNGDNSANTNGLTSGYHILEITDAHACLFTDSVEVTFQNAAPNITLPDSVEKCTENTIMLDAGPDGASYMWSTGDTGQVITTTAGGLIIVTVTGENGCEAVHFLFIQNNPCPTGIASITDIPLIKVYPNPSNGLVQIEVMGDLDRALDVAVMDLTGRTVFSQPSLVRGGSSTASLNLADLAKGSYLLRMSQGGELVSVTTIVLQ